jgi:hypothetical protein
LRELIRLGYLTRHNLEFIGVARHTLEQNTAEVTVASDTTKQYLLQTPIYILGNKVVIIQIPSLEPSTNSLGLEALTTTILMRGLPIEFSQTQIIVVLHHLLGTKNVVAVTFNRAQDDPMGRYDGMALIRCLNAAVYTHWYTCRVVPLLGKQVDFVPHAKSIFGSSPPAMAARAQADIKPTRHIIEEVIIALKNEGPATPNLTKIETTIRNAEGRIKDHIEALGSNINLHTTTKVDAAYAAQQQHHSHILQQLQLLSTISKEYSNHMSCISSALLQGSLKSTDHHLLGLRNIEDVNK